MIKGLIFDCFGVLTADTWKEFVASLPEEQRRSASALNRAFGASFLDKDEFVKAIIELTNEKPHDIDRMLDNETNKNTELLEYIKTLKPKYKIGLLSNVASNWIRDSLLTEVEQQLFDDITLSYEVRLTKPDPRIFKLAADKLGLEPQECIMVDDVENYCRVAESVGMKSVCYNDFRQAKPDIEALLRAN